MKSSPKRKVAFKTVSHSKRSNFLTGLKHKLESHVRHTTSVIPDDIEVNSNLKKNQVNLIWLIFNKYVFFSRFPVRP